MRRRAWAAGVLVLAPLLTATGCGDDGTIQAREDDDRFEDYCEEVEDQQRALTEALAEGAASGLLDALPSFRALSDVAPSDIADDWKIVIDAVEDLEKALEDADVDPATYDRAEPPEGLSTEDQEAIDEAAQGLVTQETGLALEGVQQHARDVCKNPLSLN